MAVNKSKLVIPRYKITELIKSVDIDVDELIPEFPEIDPNFVPLSVFVQQQEKNNRLVETNGDLEFDLNIIEQLELELEQLIQQITNDIVERQSSQEIIRTQIESLTPQFDKIGNRVNESFQTSVETGLNKINIQAQADAVLIAAQGIKEDIDQLKELIELSDGVGRLGELLDSLGETADGGVEVPPETTTPQQFNVRSILVTPNGQITGIKASNNNTNPSINFTIEITNQNSQPANVRIEHRGTSSGWASWLFFNPSVTIPGNGSFTVQFRAIPTTISNSLVPKNKISFRSPQTYTGELILTETTTQTEISKIRTSIEKSRR